MNQISLNLDEDDDNCCDMMSDVDSDCKLSTTDWVMADESNMILPADDDDLALLGLTSTDFRQTTTTTTLVRSTQFISRQQQIFIDEIFSNLNGTNHTDSCCSSCSQCDEIGFPTGNSSCSPLSSLSSGSNRIGSSSNSSSTTSPLDSDEDPMPIEELQEQNEELNRNFYRDHIAGGPEMVFLTSAGLSCFDDCLDEDPDLHRSPPLLDIIGDERDSSSCSSSSCSSNTITDEQQICDNKTGGDSTQPTASNGDPIDYTTKRRKISKPEESTSVQPDQTSRTALAKIAPKFVSKVSRGPSFTAESVFLNTLDLKKYVTSDGLYEYINEVVKFGLLDCIICHQLVSLNCLVRHIYEHSSPLELVQGNWCPRCFNRQKDRKEFMIHRRLHSYKLFNTCLICMQTFLSEKKFATHLTKDHSRHEMPYICSICWYQTSVLSEFFNHLERHLDFMCPLCLEVIISEQMIAEFNFDINDTEKRIAYSVLFQRIIRCHFQQHFAVLDSYKCKRCVLTFIDKARLDQHTFNNHPPPGDATNKFTNFSNKKFILSSVTLPSRIMEKCRKYSSVQEYELIFGLGWLEKKNQHSSKSDSVVPFSSAGNNKIFMRSPSLHSGSSDESNESDETDNVNRPMRLTTELKQLVRRDSMDSLNDVSDFYSFDNILVTHEIKQKLKEIIKLKPNRTCTVEMGSFNEFTENSSESSTIGSVVNVEIPARCVECNQSVCLEEHFLKTPAVCYFETCKFSTFCQFAFKQHLDHTKRVSRNTKTMLIKPKYLKFKNCLSNSVSTMFNCRHCGAIFDDLFSLARHMKSASHKRGGFASDY